VCGESDSYFSDKKVIGFRGFAWGDSNVVKTCLGRNFYFIGSNSEFMSRKSPFKGFSTILKSLENLFKIFQHKKKKMDFIHLPHCLATSYSYRGRPPTTIGAEELNFRVRYGNGCDLFAIITRPSFFDKHRISSSVLSLRYSRMCNTLRSSKLHFLDLLASKKTIYSVESMFSQN
jgi:hypothetical protein